MLHFSLQRATELRRNATALRALHNQQDTTVILLSKTGVAVRDGAMARIAFRHLPEPIQARSLFLGLYPTPLFAVYLTDEDEGFIATDYRFETLRAFAVHASAADVANAFQASALFSWQQNHRFCGLCGGLNEWQATGHEARCTQCQTAHFPRTDPAVIVAVLHEDRLLLGRQASWPAKRYSLLAGFVEPGESLEQACVREIMEESGIRLRSVTYITSQSWPFPSSLMLAFEAQAESTDIQLNDKELEEAHWFSRADLELAVREARVVLPPSASVARELTARWYEQGGGRWRDLMNLQDGGEMAWLKP